MSDDPLGSESTTAVPRHNGQSFVASGGVSGGGVSGDTYASSLVTAGTRSTGAMPLQPTRGKRTPSKSFEVIPKVKHTCSALFATCLDNLDLALDHNEGFFLRSNAIEQVKDTLSELWNVRSQREEPFREVINMLQGIFAQRTVNDFTTDKLNCLRSAFKRLHENPVYDDATANEITVKLLNGGIDVFRELE